MNVCTHQHSYVLYYVKMMLPHGAAIATAYLPRQITVHKTHTPHTEHPHIHMCNCVQRAHVARCVLCGNLGALFGLARACAVMLHTIHSHTLLVTVTVAVIVPGWLEEVEVENGGEWQWLVYLSQRYISLALWLAGWLV